MVQSVKKPNDENNFTTTNGNDPEGSVAFTRKAVAKEPLIYSEVAEAQRCTSNIQSLKRLNIGEKRRSHFRFSSLKNVRDEFFRVYLICLSGAARPNSRRESHASDKTCPD